MQKTWLPLLGFVLALTGRTDAGQNQLAVKVHGLQPVVSPTQSVRLVAKASWGGPKAELRYSWRAVGRSDALPYDHPRDTAELVLPAEGLAPGEHYELEVEVVARYHDPKVDPPEQEVRATSVVSFDVNAPPEGGRCELEVTWQGKAGAHLVVSAPDWKDDRDARLQYQFTVLRNDERAAFEHWSHKTKVVVPLVAKPGDTLRAHCAVRDGLGDASEADSKSATRPQ